MSDNLLIGMMLGFTIGALLVHNNQNASKIIEEGKEKVKQAIDKI